MSGVNRCSPDNVIAELFQLTEQAGHNPDGQVIEKLDDAGKATYYGRVNQHATEVLAESADSSLRQILDAQVSDQWFNDAKNAVASTFHFVRNPSGVLSKDIVQPVIEAYQDFLLTYGDQYPQHESQLTSTLREIFDQAEGLSPVPDRLLDYYRGYKQFHLGGGILFNKGTGPLDLAYRASNNLTRNTLGINSTVLLGNIPEAIIKIPTVYGITNTAKGLKALTEEHGPMALWKRIPDLEAQGVYGFDHLHEMGSGSARASRGIVKVAKQLDKTLTSINGLSDTPFKNLAYAAGVAAEGSEEAGFRAIQNLSFMPRLGDEPPMKWHPASRLATRLLGYTIGTYKMYGSFWGDLLAPGSTAAVRLDAARKIGYFHALNTILGGAAANVPEPLSWIFNAATDGAYKEWEDENLAPAGRLVQFGSIRIAPIVQSATTLSLASAKAAKKAAEYIASGDLAKGAESALESAFTLLPFTPVPLLGLKPLQAVVQEAGKVWREEQDADEGINRINKRLFPFMQRD